MASKVTLLSAFIVTKANQLGMTIPQLIAVTDAQIVDAIPEQHRDKLTAVIMRKARQSALGLYANQKVTELADSQDFKDAVDAVIPDLVIPEAIIRRVVISRIKELRAQ